MQKFILILNQIKTSTAVIFQCFKQGVTLIDVKYRENLGDGEIYWGF